MVELLVQTQRSKVQISPNQMFKAFLLDLIRTQNAYLDPLDDMLVLLPLLDLMESPLFTTFLPSTEKLLSIYSSSG